MEMEDNFEELIFRASLCERAEKYEDMVRVMKEAIKLMNPCGISPTGDTDKSGADSKSLNEAKSTATPASNITNSIVKARNLFSVAYKNLAGARRASWRILMTELAKHEGKDEKKTRIVREYMRLVETELNGICDDVLGTIDSLVSKTPSFGDVESCVFFLKMKGDYLRYKAEVCEENPQESKRVGELSHQNYLNAMEVANNLKSTNPVKLGLALNYSVYLYEIRKDCTNACNVAREAFDVAIAGLEELSEEHYKDSTLIMQLLRDNMTLWTHQEETMKEDEEEQLRRDIERDEDM